MKQLLVGIFLTVIIPVLHAQTAYHIYTPEISTIKLYDSVACTPVQDQSSSPTCWAFGINSLFESELIKKYRLNINLSEMFIARYAYIDKAVQWLATKGTTYFEGGGQFQDEIRIIKKYGMVPESVYTGRPHGERVHNHAGLDTAMKVFMNALLQKGKTELTANDLNQVNDTLDKYLGRVPFSFLYKNKRYTPKTFARDVVKFTNDYVEMVSFADNPYYKKFMLADKYNWARDSFYNIPLNDLLIAVDTAIAKGWSVAWEGDVTETGFNYLKGLASLTDSVHNYDAERVANYKDESTERDHLMHIVGIAKDSANNKWYYLKNSWGKYNVMSGFLFMQENYFKLKTVNLMVNKNALPQSIRAKLGLK